MRRAPKVVLDASVLVSALISSKGSPAEIVRLWEAAQMELVVSVPILDELGRVLRYPHIQDRYGLTDATVRRFLELLAAQATVVSPTIRLSVVAQDPSDDRYLEAALAAQAQYLVSGDRHLLTLGRYRGVEILPPAGFVALAAANRL